MNIIPFCSLALIIVFDCSLCEEQAPNGISHFYIPGIECRSTETEHCQHLRWLKYSDGCNIVHCVHGAAMKTANLCPHEDTFDGSIEATEACTKIRNDLAAAIVEHSRGRH